MTLKRICGITCLTAIVALPAGCAIEPDWAYDTRPEIGAEPLAEQPQLRRVEAQPIELLAADSLGYRLHQHQRRSNAVDD